MKAPPQAEQASRHLPIPTQACAWGAHQHVVHEKSAVVAGVVEEAAEDDVGAVGADPKGRN